MKTHFQAKHVEEPVSAKLPHVMCAPSDKHFEDNDFFSFQEAAELLEDQMRHSFKIAPIPECEQAKQAQRVGVTCGSGDCVGDFRRDPDNGWLVMLTGECSIQVLFKETQDLFQP